MENRSAGVAQSGPTDRSAPLVSLPDGACLSAVYESRCDRIPAPRAGQASPPPWASAARAVRSAATGPT